MLAVTYQTPTSCQNAKNSFWPDDQSWASLRHLFDLCWTASPRWSTTYYLKRSPTTWQKAMCSTSSSSSRTQILTPFLRHAYTIKTLLSSSRASTPTGSSIAGGLLCNFSRLLWVPAPMKLSLWRQLLETPQVTLSRAAHVVPWMWPGKSSFVTLNASSWCLWRWPNFPLAPQFMNRFEAPLWALLWALRCAWWSSLSRKKSGTEPTKQPCLPWTSQLVYFVMLTIDFALQILPGTTTFALPISCTRSFTATRSSWKLSRIRSSWASALSSNLSHYATAPRETSTRSWPHSRHHPWRCNFQALFHGSFW